jgi:hypothetical protein
MKTLPLAPCDSCLTDATATADVPIGVACYCPHHRTLAIHDARVNVWISFTGLDVETAAETTASAIAHHLASIEPVNTHAI